MSPDSLNIRTISHLALRLGLAEDYLLRLAARVPRHVRHESKRKEDSEGYREIYIPSEELKYVQRRIYDVLLKPLPLPECLHGSVPGRSARTNAMPHVGRAAVASLDIRDFFPSIRHESVYKLFIDLGCTPDVARILTKLTTSDHHLCQGFPTSSAIANLVMARIEPRLSALASQHELNLSINVDDITLSGSRRVRSLLNLFSRIFRQCQLVIKRSKTRVAYQSEQQQVTGWVVNSKVNVSRAEYRRLRAVLHKSATDGIEQVADRPVPEFRQHLRGRIQRVLEVNPARGQPLLDTYNRL